MYTAPASITASGTSGVSLLTVCLIPLQSFVELSLRSRMNGVPTSDEACWLVSASRDFT